jgi:hypothetical protein
MEQTQTYVAKVWYLDLQTWFNLVSLAVLLLSDKDFLSLIPDNYELLVAKLVIALNLVIRYVFTVRPIAMQHGTEVEVETIPTK